MVSGGSGGPRAAVPGTSHIAAVEVRAQSCWRRTAVCCGRPRRWNLRSGSIGGRAGMLGRRAGRSPWNLVMLNFARESCSCPFAVATARHGVRCGAGGRSCWLHGRHCKATEAAEVASRLVAGLGGGAGGAGHLENGGGAAAAIGGGGQRVTLRCAATRPNARCHAEELCRHVGATAHGAAMGTAMRGALAPLSTMLDTVLAATAARAEP